MNKNNLGKYDLNQLLRNPGLVHKIQDNLIGLDWGNLMLSGSILGVSIVSYAKTAIEPLIKILHSEAAKDREQVTKLIGEETMKLIDEYMEGSQPEVTNDKESGKSPNDLPNQLFNQP